MTRLRRPAAALVLTTSCAALLISCLPRPARAQQPARSSYDFIRIALANNGELAAVRLELERARARVRQAGLRPNPSLDVEQRTGRLTGSPGEGGPSVGVAIPLELFGQRSSRIDLATAELDAAEAALAERERRLAAEVRTRYAEALAAARELRIVDDSSAIDASTARIVSARVSEGESAPLEYRLLQVEVDRLRSRRAVVEAKYESALVELRLLAGLDASSPVALGDELAAASWPGAPASVGEAIDAALRTRPDLRLARLEERVAAAGLALATARSAPEVTAFGRVSVDRAVFDDTPVGAIRDRDTTLSFGVTVGIPIFDRNQGAKAEAATGIAIARRRREAVEQRIRADVATAYGRLRASDAAIATFERGVIARSNENLRSIRGAYQIGAYRVTELLAEQRRVVDAEREYVETLAERYRALADLQTAVGASAPFVERAPDPAPDATSGSRDAYPGLVEPRTLAPASDRALPIVADEREDGPTPRRRATARSVPHE